MLWKKKKIRKKVRTTEVNKIVTVVLKKDDISYADEAYQWNYGQILRIQGGNLPKVVEVHFSLEETSGTSVTRIGTTTDGVTEAPIPDSHLENNNCSQDYTIYAYIYLEDGTAGRTEYEIAIPVKARTKPEVPGTPEEPELFRETVKAVNDAADRAETAVADAEEIRDNLNLDLSEKITRPQTAEVGQVLAVKETDEDGTPTVFEAEDVKVPTKTSELKNDSGFLTEHQDISGKLDKDKLPEAIDDALEQAKESGEFNGKDGAPGEKGEKGDPGETTYIENPYDDTKIKKDIAAKVGYSEVVGNQLLMYADDTKEKLLATLELPRGVEDVKVGGKSIVGDGSVAEIPMATITPGLVKVSPSFGVGNVNGSKDGYLCLWETSKANINARVNKYQPLTTTTLDYAVKAAMCDGKGVAWTAEEQAASRERMGLISEDDFELITTVNPSKEEIVSSISIDLAEPIKANFYIVCDIGIIDRSLNYVNIPKLELAINDYYTWVYQSLQKSSTEVRYMLMQIPICKKSGLVILSNPIPINNGFQSNTNISGNGLGIVPYSDRNYSKGITKIKIGAKDNYSWGYFSKNTVFAIYGKRI